MIVGLRNKMIVASALASIYGTEAFIDPKMMEGLDLEGIMKNMDPQTIAKAKEMMKNPNAMKGLEDAMKDPKKMESMMDMAKGLMGGKDGKGGLDMDKIKDMAKNMNLGDMPDLDNLDLSQLKKPIADSEDAADDNMTKNAYPEDAAKDEEEAKKEADKKAKKEAEKKKKKAKKAKKNKKNKKAKKPAMPDLGSLGDMGNMDELMKNFDPSKMEEMMKSLGLGDGLGDLMKNLGGMGGDGKDPLAGMGDLFKGLGDLPDMKNTMDELKKDDKKAIGGDSSEDSAFERLSSETVEDAPKTDSSDIDDMVNRIKDEGKTEL